MDTKRMNDERLVMADMLQALPESVQRYMAYSGVVGRPWINTVCLKQAGRFRLFQERPWMPIVWNFPSGDLPYWEGEITEIEYNQPIEAF